MKSTGFEHLTTAELISVLKQRVNSMMPRPDALAGPLVEALERLREFDCAHPEMSAATRSRTLLLDNEPAKPVAAVLPAVCPICETGIAGLPHTS